MATPKFDLISLTTRGERMIEIGPDARLLYDTLPGVDGEYVQTHGHTGRTFRVTGFLESTENDTRVEALKEVRHTGAESVREKVGGVYGTFLDVDGNSWTDCVLVSYTPGSEYYFRRGTTDKTKFICGLRINAVIRSVAESAGP
jgi:hypothetical protein